MKFPVEKHDSVKIQLKYEVEPVFFGFRFTASKLSKAKIRSIDKQERNVGTN